MKKIFCLFLCVIALFCVSSPVCVASDIEDEVQFTLNVEERFTDISVVDDAGKYVPQTEDEIQQERNKKIYVIVLVVLLVASLIFLVYTLKKVPSEKEIEEKDTEEVLGNTSEEKEE